MKSRFLGGLMTILLVLSGMMLAQTSNGTIAGTVTDQTNSVVVGATITAKSLDTGTTYTATTSSVGAYRIEAVLPGTYTLTVTATGFATTKISSVSAQASLITAVNPVLRPGNVENVEVVAGAEALQTETGDLSSTIPEKVISELPVGGGNPYSLALTLPGVSTVTSVSGFTNGTEFSVNGTRPRANNFLIEGQDNNDAGIHGQGMQPGNLEAVKEVVVMQNSYAAEFGHGGGSVNNLVYKSGSNQFHGSLWDRLTNSSLDANDHNSNIYDVKKSKYRENIFGFTVGGPVVKDKAFFFASYQWDKYRGSQTGNPLTIPTAAGLSVLQSYSSNPRIANYLKALGSMVSNNPTSTCTDANPIGMLGPDPASGIDRGCVEYGTYTRTVPANSESPELDLKGDYIISPKDTLSLRYIRTHYETPYDLFNNPDQFAGFDALQSGTAHNAGITEVHTFNANVINEFRLSYGRIGFTFDNRPDTYATPLATSPTIGITGISGWGANGSVPQGRFHNTLQAQDSVSYNTGHHSFKFGADVADIRVRDAVPFNFYGSIGYDAGGGYTALANYMDDFSGTGNMTAERTFGSNVIHPELVSQNYFAQDTWKLRSNLTLVLGLRYENNGTPANSLKYPALDPKTYWSLPYPTRTPQQRENGNWGPRVGIAYTPHILKSIFGEDKTVLRAGYGIFYDGIFTNIIDNTVASSPNNINSQNFGDTTSNTRGTANWSSYVPTSAQDPLQSDGVTSMAAKLKSPVTYQWNVDIQRELAKSTTLTVSYVGTRGLHLFANNQINAWTPEGDRIHPDFGSTVYRDNSGDSMYHSLQVDVEKKMSHGLMVRAAYTYSKMMDDTSEVFTAGGNGNWSSYPVVQYGLSPSRRSTDWGLSALDHRQRLAISYLYEIPKIKAEAAAMAPVKAVFNGWQISGITSFQSGTPYNMEVGYDTNGDGIYNDRPDLVTKSAPFSSWGWDQSWLGIGPAGTYCDGPGVYYGGYCDPVAASSIHWAVAANGVGNIQRNFMIGPAYTNWDFSLQRTIKLHENHRLDIRAEFLNVFNHANSDVPVATLIDSVKNDPRNSNSSLGNTSMTAHGNRKVHMLIRYQF
jgi:outer membrane receptor protein involved in Fe transport